MSDKKRILVVEDSKLMRQVISQFLGRIGYETQTANCGLEALALIKEAAPDLVITDLVMPNGDGLSLMRDLKNQECKVPVIVLTSLSDGDTKAKILNEGVKGYFKKPVNLDKVAKKAIQLIGAP